MSEENIKKRRYFIDRTKQPHIYQEGGIPTPTMTEVTEEEWRSAFAVAMSQPLPLTPRDINLECQRRIYAVASPNTQQNMTAYVTAGLATTAEKNVFKAALAWVAEMRAKARELVAGMDETYQQDKHWPTCPADVVEFANRF